MSLAAEDFAPCSSVAAIVAEDWVPDLPFVALDSAHLGLVVGRHLPYSLPVQSSSVPFLNNEDMLSCGLLESFAILIF